MLAMLVFFGFGTLVPFIFLGCMAAALAYRSIPAMLFLALTGLDCLLPPGKVSYWLHSRYPLSMAVSDSCTMSRGSLTPVCTQSPAIPGL